MQSIRLARGPVLRAHVIPGHGTPLVFLHGLGCASSCDYPPLAAHASLLGPPMVLVDLLGFGFSDKPDDFPYAIASHAECVVELLQHLGISSANLYGHSMGGSIAIAAAALASGHVCSLVLSEPNLDPGGGTFSRGIAAQAEIDYVREGHDRCIAEAIRTGNLTWAASMRVASARAVHRSATSLVQGSAPSWREQLLQLSLPRTLLFGEKSLPDPDFDTLPAAGIRVGVVPGVGHSMAWENPGALAQCLGRTVMAHPAVG